MHSLFRNTSWTGLAGLCLLLCGASTAQAICVSNSGTLQSALIQGEQQTQPYTIKIAQGSYSLTGDLNLSMAKKTSIEGGYNANCTARFTNPANTVISFGGASVDIFQIDDSPQAALSIDGVTLTGANKIDLLAGAPADQLCAPWCGERPGRLQVTNTRMTGISGGSFLVPDTSPYNGVIHLGGYAGETIVTNVQFDHINALTAGDACEVSMELNSDSSTTLEYVTADLSGGKNFCLLDGDSGDHDVAIYNSIFWASDATLGGLLGGTQTGLDEDDPINATIVNSLYRAYSGRGPATSTGQQFPLPQSPLWVNAAVSNYTLAPSNGSGINVAINTGVKSVPKGNPIRDIVGNARAVGSAPDLGAYESASNDSDLFTVTNTSECNTFNCGSLRDAMTRAMISSQASVTIRFAIPNPQNPQQGLCPAVINVNSALPDITKSITIDGYTQSPAQRSSDQGGAFTGTFCVVLQPADNNAYYAFRVPAAADGGSLYLSGIAFGAFPVGVELLGGGNHQIVGNQFGGLINGQTYQLYGSTVANIYMDAPSGQVTIGGDDPANRNVFLNTTSYIALPSSAVQIGYHVKSNPSACQIVSNLFGLQDDGTFTSKNMDAGIYIQGSGCLVSGNRIAGVFKDAINIDSSAGGGNDNVVRNNIIGLAQDIDPTTSNGGAGIRINGGHNIIGYPAGPGSVPSQSANYITHMDGGGAVVGSGFGNTIRGNILIGNGVSGDGLSIDLGGNGPSPDDFADPDGGPNKMQNFATLRSIDWVVPPKANTANLAATLKGRLNSNSGPGFYQVDAYYTVGCNASGRGAAERWIGSDDYVYIPANSVFGDVVIPVLIPEYDAANGSLSVTTTNLVTGDYATSEVSPCLSVDTVFKDGAEAF